jgi:uncharacterized protein (UPF0548 family)
VGASAGSVPQGFNVDRNSTRLGRGEGIWGRAVEAVREWKMFSIPFITVYPPNASIKVGTEVIVMVNHFGIYSLNACRIIYVVEEENAVKRFGFAYGTLSEHAESGEERFTVEWHSADNTVSYHILAFSRPRVVLAKMASPLARSVQKKFAAGSLAAMTRAVQQL